MKLVVFNRFISESAKKGFLAFLTVVISGVALLIAAPGNDKGGIIEDEKQKESQFIAKLANGVTVELVGICEYSTESKNWWQPDGLPLGDTIFVKFDGSLGCATKCSTKCTTKCVTNVKGEGKPYMFVVRIDGPTDLNFKWSQIGNARCFTVGKVIDEHGSDIENMYVAIANIGGQIENVTLRLAVASGPWQSEATHSGKGIMSVGLKKGGIAFSEAYESKKGVKIVVSDDLGEVDHRIAAIDSEGNILQVVSKPWASAGRMRQTTAEFKNLTLEQIKGFQFQTRPYESVEFKNISLKPGVKTDVL